MEAILILAEASETAGTSFWGGLWQSIAGSPFAVAIVFIFLVAMIGAFVAARKRDKVLKKFRNYPVAIREQAGRIMWGTLRVFSNGLELIYADKDPAENGASKGSFLIYQAELGRILEIVRYKDRLDAKAVGRRRRQTLAMADPNIAFRFWRWVRGVTNTFRDAIVKAMSMAMGQATKARPGGALSAQSGQIGSIGATVVGETANAYEPMLEQYIGDPVVAEIVNPADAEKKVVECHGYLGEYSAQFFILVDVEREERRSLAAGGGPHHLLEREVTLSVEGEVLHVENSSGVDLRVERVVAGEKSETVERTVAGGSSEDIAVGEILSAEGAQIEVSWSRKMDIVLPRSCASVRHASEPVETDEDD